MDSHIGARHYHICREKRTRRNLHTHSRDIICQIRCGIRLNVRGNIRGASSTLHILVLKAGRLRAGDVSDFDHRPRSGVGLVVIYLRDGALGRQRGPKGPIPAMGPGSIFYLLVSTFI